MAIISCPEPVEAPNTNLAQLRAALQANSLELLGQVLPMNVPIPELTTLLQHPRSEFRDWTWMNGGIHVVSTATTLLWQEHSLSLVYDYAQQLGAQAFYESYYYHANITTAADLLSHVEFMGQMAPTIGYPDLKWAVTTSEELLTLALRNPLLHTRYLQRVCRWAESSSETEVEAQILRESLHNRLVVAQ